MPLAFSPYHFSVFVIFSLAYLFHTILKSTFRQSVSAAYFFGLGMFGFGINWLHVSINLYGGFSLPSSLLLTFIFISIIALYPALFAFLYKLLSADYKDNAGLLVLMPVLWTLVEWFRSKFLVEFPWLNIGYSQIDTPIAALAPIFGIYGLSWFTAFSAAALVCFFSVSRSMKTALFGVLLLTVFVLNILRDVHWTVEQTDEIAFAMVQGAIPQRQKWQLDQRERIVEFYDLLSDKYPHQELLIWPETAIPGFYHQMQGFIQRLEQKAATQQRDYLVGVPFDEGPAGGMYNGIAVIGSSDDIYYKRHLVPFGEYMPLRNWLSPLGKLLAIPMSDFSAGQAIKPLISAVDKMIGVSICYEGIFGEEIIQALPEADLLVNISDDSWFGDSIGPHQHLQMIRMRALETGRYMLRATNTGISAIIDENGHIIETAPQFIPYVLRGKAKLFSGSTPYARFGNGLVIIPAWILLLVMQVRLIRRNTG